MADQAQQQYQQHAPNPVLKQPMAIGVVGNRIIREGTHFKLKTSAEVNHADIKKMRQKLPIRKVLKKTKQKPPHHYSVGDVEKNESSEEEEQDDNSNLYNNNQKKDKTYYSTRIETKKKRLTSSVQNKMNLIFGNDTTVTIRLAKTAGKQSCSSSSGVYSTEEAFSSSSNHAANGENANQRINLNRQQQIQSQNQSQPLSLYLGKHMSAVLQGVSPTQLMESLTNIAEIEEAYKRWSRLEEAYINGYLLKRQQNLPQQQQQQQQQQPQQQLQVQEQNGRGSVFSSPITASAMVSANNNNNSENFSVNQIEQEQLEHKSAMQQQPHPLSSSNNKNKHQAVIVTREGQQKQPLSSPDKTEGDYALALELSKKLSPTPLAIRRGTRDGLTSSTLQKHESNHGVQSREKKRKQKGKALGGTTTTDTKPNQNKKKVN